jgi:hypothetical protein
VTGAVLTPGNASWILFGVFFTLMVLRVPVAFALGSPATDLRHRAAARLWDSGAETFNAYNSFILLAAVPAAANPFNVSGIRTACAPRALVGHFPEKIAQVNVVLSIFFAGFRARPPPTPRASRKSSSRLNREATTSAFGCHHRGRRPRGDHSPSI